MEKKKEIKQVINKSVSVRNFENVEKQPVFNLPKWKIIIANIFNIPIAKNYRYAVKVNYYGSVKLKPRDVVTDSSNNVYTVMKELNRVALLLSYTVMDSRPNLNGKLKIQGREINK